MLKNSSFLYLILAILLFHACAASPEERLKNIAEETLKACPLMIDEYTVMQKAEALPGRTLKFTYGLKGTFGESIKQEMNNAMKPVLIEKLKHQPEQEFYQENDVRFEHLFLDDQGRTVMHIIIEPADY